MMGRKYVGASALRGMAEEIAGLLAQRSGLLPAHSEVQVTDSFDNGRHMVSVAVRDATGSPLFAVNVELQGPLPARLALRNTLYRKP